MEVSLKDLKIKLFADGADLSTMISMANLDYIQGLTTNPTLMRKAGISDYKKFALQVLNEITSKPISFEIFCDDFEEMIYQGMEIASWGDNVYVKIPVTSSTGESSIKVIDHLVKNKVKVNVTALLTTAQVAQVLQALDPEIPSYISVFAGRIADTGRDPVEIMSNSLELMKTHTYSELIWASPRELLNIFQADSIGCHVITATPDLLNKLKLVGKNLDEYSLETVQMFRQDAIASGYTL